MKIIRKRLCTKCGLEYVAPIKKDSIFYGIIVQQLKLHDKICNGKFIDI